MCGKRKGWRSVSCGIFESLPVERLNWFCFEYCGLFPCGKELGSLCIDVNEVCESQVEKKIPRSPTSCDRSVIDKMGEVYHRYYLTPSCEGQYLDTLCGSYWAGF